VNGTGFGPGSCGELVQGVTSAGNRFQVSLPLDSGTTATAEVAPASQTSVRIGPAHRWKAARAAQLCLHLLEVPPQRVALQLDSALTVGRGMGSSTADIVATARAVADALDRPLSREDAGLIAGAIEPSDATMYDGIAVADRRGALLRDWSWWPTFNVVMLVPPTVVVTESVDFRGQEQNAAVYETLLRRLDEAVSRRDSAAFVAAAELSADLNQRHLANPLLETAREWRGPLGALGCNIAHTGSLVGLLFAGDAAGRSAAGDACRRLRHVPRLRGVDVLLAATPASAPLLSARHSPLCAGT